MTDEPQAIVDWERELRTLLDLRLAAAGQKAVVAGAWEAVQATEEYHSWLAQSELKKDADAAVADFEAVVRLAAVSEYRRTGTKDIARGVAVRMKNILTYDDAPALAYCKAGFAAALTFDRKVLDKVLLSMDANILPAFVARTQEPQATIATDLDKALHETP